MGGGILTHERPTGPSGSVQGQSRPVASSSAKRSAGQTRMPSSVTSDRWPPWARIRRVESRELRDRAESAKHGRMQPASGFRFHGEKLAAALEEEVHFGVGFGRRPVVDPLEERLLLGMCPKQAENPAFEQRAPLLGRDRPGKALRRADEAGVGPVELGTTALPDAQLRFEGRKPPGEQRVLQDFEISGDRCSRHASVPGDSRDAQCLAVEQGGDREEADEPADIADGRLRADFLPQVETPHNHEASAPAPRRRAPGEACPAGAPAPDRSGLPFLPG